jgi:hypothetical protein
LPPDGDGVISASGASEMGPTSFDIDYLQRRGLCSTLSHFL